MKFLKSKQRIQDSFGESYGLLDHSSGNISLGGTIDQAETATTMANNKNRPITEHGFADESESSTIGERETDAFWFLKEKGFVQFNPAMPLCQVADVPEIKAEDVATAAVHTKETSIHDMKETTTPTKPIHPTRTAAIRASVESSSASLRKLHDSSTTISSMKQQSSLNNGKSSPKRVPSRLRQRRVVPEPDPSHVVVTTTRVRRILDDSKTTNSKTTPTARPAHRTRENQTLGPRTTLLATTATRRRNKPGRDRAPPPPKDTRLLHRGSRNEASLVAHDVVNTSPPTTRVSHVGRDNHNESFLQLDV